MRNQFQTPSTNPDATHVELTDHLRQTLGEKRLAKIYNYREQRRKDMLGLCQEYGGDDRKLMHQLGKLWLKLLDHTLWNVDNRSNAYFTPDLRLYDLNIVGLCYEWHDFATFAHIANKLPGYLEWAQKVEGDEYVPPRFIFRTRPGSRDLLLRPTSAVFYAIEFGLPSVEPLQTTN